jgi:cytoskeleton protein RodZ
MNPTVGQQLREAREKLGISLEDAAHETHIRLNYLQELENDHPELLRSTPQARGFLRLYADFLKLSYPDLLAALESNLEPQPQPEAKPEMPATPADWLKNFLPIKKPKNDQEEKPGEPAAAPQTVPQPEDAAEVQQEKPAVVQPPEATAETEHDSAVLDEESPEVEMAEKPPVSDQDTKEVKKPAATILQALTALGARISHGAFIVRLFKRGNTSETALGTSPEFGQPAPTQSSEEIFRQIGLSLQNRRKMMDLNLADIENFTNLKRSFLVALEEGRFNDLPSTVQGRGMLNNYAKFLGMEETSVMELYGQALQLQREEKLKPQRKAARPPLTVNVNLPEKWRKIINPDLIIGSLLILGLFAFIIWGASQVLGSNPGSSTEAPSISEMLQITPSVSPPPDLTGTDQAQATVETTPLPGVAVALNTPTVVATVNSAPLQVYIIAHDRAYLKVEVDGKDAFTGRVVPNNVYTYSGKNAISLLTGNASALEVYFNQQYVGKLGGVGEVRSVDFTLQGLITPTPQAKSTATPEPNLATQQAEEAASKQ